MKSVLNKPVSCFRNATTTEAPQEVNLLTWLTSDKHSERVELVRASDKDRQKELKQSLPMVIIAGTFGGKKKEDLINYNSLLVLDFDNVENPACKKAELSVLPYVAYAGLSAGGRGVFAIVPVSAQPSLYAAHHISLEQELEGVDNSGRNYNRCRYYSYDPKAYFNHNAEPYLKVWRDADPQNQLCGYGDTFVRACQQVEIIRSKGIDITNSDYNTRLKIGFALRGEFGENGRALFHNICAMSPKYKMIECEKKYDDLMKVPAHNVAMKINYLFALLKNWL